MLGWLVRIILAYFVVRAIWQLLDGLMKGMSGAGSHESGRGDQPPLFLARDPVCGTFVVPSRALTAGTGGDTRFFCSERCRQAWGHR
jgi:YHS domain-containing protein